jgi:N-acetylglucosamine-6-phosphate deacetylase
MRQVLAGVPLFDGKTLHDGMALVVEDGTIVGLEPATGIATLHGGILAPGFVDLQVNGGAGLMLDGQTAPDRIATICAAHLRLGCAGILPTLITDTRDTTRQVIAAGIKAIGTPGFLGLHLEGPHLDPRRKGAHDATLIRAMDGDDLAALMDAAKALPTLMVTVAPESVTPDQIATLTKAGVIVSLGHSDCSYDVAINAIRAGASCATHLFNAMSPLSHREPGLVGAILDSSIAAGIIADGHHVAPAALRIALAARPDGLFAVSDSMAFADTDLTQITLGGRTINRANGRLTLADGTLAGADLRLDRALQVLIHQAGIPTARALAMVTSVPAAVIGKTALYGHLAPGRRADIVHLGQDMELQQVWHGGVALLPETKPFK